MSPLTIELPPGCGAITEAKAAIGHFSNGPLTPFQAAMARAKRWKNGRTLKVRFRAGHIALQARVAKYARSWSNYANITFEVGDDPEAEIRVAFDEGDGSWSAVGTDALVEAAFLRHQPTMNFLVECPLIRQGR